MLTLCMFSTCAGIAVFNNQEIFVFMFPGFQPVVSTGNVGQLAVDLLISYGSSHECVTWVGSLETAHVLPACGYEAYPGQPPRLVTTLELYVFDKRKVAVVQQRAPVVSSANAEFAADLLSWAKASGFQVRCFSRSFAWLTYSSAFIASLVC
jgi:predicted ATP-grasp superfamily ATP-dependent carboligase